MSVLINVFIQGEMFALFPMGSQIKVEFCKSVDYETLFSFTSDYTFQNTWFTQNSFIILHQNIIISKSIC
jgi:hypothetical protein